MSNNQTKDKSSTLLDNKKARFEYEIIEDYEAGIVLTGTEVKSIRAKNFSFLDSYAKIKNGEIWLVNLHISPFKQASYNNHEPTRPRKLLLNKREIRKLLMKIKEKGLTLVPLRLYLKNGLIKVKLGLCKGKKLYDKRDTTQKREADRDLKRTAKDYNRSD